MYADIERIIIDEEALASGVNRLSQEITAKYESDGEPLILVPIMSGAVVFLADLMRKLPIRTILGLVGVSSYRNRTHPAADAVFTAHFDDALDVRDRRVLIVDDILDTGGTLALVQEDIARRAPRSIETVVLLRKPGKARESVRVDYVGFDIEDVFVVGYGLDYNGLFRNLPHIAVLKPDRYAAS